MEHEIVRLIADALADTDHGVGAVLAQVPRSSGDALPATPPIYDETRHDFAALEEMPDELPEGVEFPCLVVTMGQGSVTFDPARPRPSKGREEMNPPSPLQNAPSNHEFEAAVNVHYFTKDSSAASARRAARYVLRAVRGAVAVLWDPSRIADREMNKVKLEVLLGLDAVSLFQPLGHVSISGACAIRVRGRELAPTITP